MSILLLIDNTVMDILKKVDLRSGPVVKAKVANMPQSFFAMEIVPNKRH
jgi:hypothetical protein